MKTFFRLLPIFSLLCIAGLSAKAQTIRAVVADRTTKAPISDVFVFLSNSSIGTATDESGTFELSLQETKEIVLVFSHINYELLTLEIADAAITRDTFLLQPNQVELNEAVVVERSRSGLRNRRLKAFSKAFLGEDTKDKQVQINNPDVLLFRQAKDRLIAAAKEPLIIENRELGYTVQFYLEAFELFDNGDLYYKGNTFFEPMEGTPKELATYQKNRYSIYRKSSRSFFSDLVQQQLDSTTYMMGFSHLDDNQNFVNFSPINPSKLIFQSEREETSYEIIIQQFLTVINQDILVEGEAPPPSKAEMNSYSKQFAAKGPQHATSYLRSKTNKIVVNKFGKILNPSDIEEYGYWAGLRVSALLPSDYAPE